MLSSAIEPNAVPDTVSGYPRRGRSPKNGEIYIDIGNKYVESERTENKEKLEASEFLINENVRINIGSGAPVKRDGFFEVYIRSDKQTA